MRTVEFENKDYELQEDAYYSNGAGDYYQALANGEDGNRYMVYWYITNENPDTCEEDEMCDWDNPDWIEKI